MVDAKRPPIITRAIPDIRAPLPLLLTAIGIIAKIVVRVVMKMGRMRSIPEVTRAFLRRKVKILSHTVCGVLKGFRY